MTPSSKISLRVVAALTTVAAAAITLPAAAAAAGPSVSPPGFTITALQNPTAGAVATGPDDIAALHGRVFVGWQNGVDTMGQPGPNGPDSTVIEYGARGQALNHWQIPGKVDGMGADRRNGQLILTVNEDGNSSLFTLRPYARPSVQVMHYTYSPAPDSATTGGIFTGGGTDAVTVQHGHILLSASNPGAANATAAFEAHLDPSTGVATLTPTFADNAMATDAKTGQRVQLAFTDPDSNATVPMGSPRFAGDFALDSQGDQQLAFTRDPGAAHSQLTRLALTYNGQGAGVDDIRWAARNGGTLYIVDNGAGAVYAVTGPFTAGEAFGSLDTVGSSANTTEVDTINLADGSLSPFVTGLSKAKGLVWVPGRS